MASTASPLPLGHPDEPAQDPSGNGRAAPPSSDALLAGLNQDQLAAVTTDSASLCILAGAGSGKTRVLTRRIAYRARAETLAPQHAVAVTFTRKAAVELRRRLRQLGLRDDVRAGTFHSIAFAQLRQRWEERRVEPPTLLERKVGFVARLVGRGGHTLPLDIVSEIEWAKARQVTAEGYAQAAAQAGRQPPVEPGVVAEVFARYEQEKARRRLVDFDDLLRLAARDLLVDDRYAAARRWMHRHLFVDEFQDLNPLQFALLRAWLGDGTDLCVVGDPNQAIYAWNGADAGYLRDFDHHFPGSETIRLVDNYRSTPQVLELAAAVLPQGRLRSNRPEGPVPSVAPLPDERAEAVEIARAARAHHSSTRSWASQAVLVRTNAQLQVVEEALRAARIPFRSRSSGSLLDQPEVKDALAGLRGHRGALAAWVRDLEHNTGPLGAQGLTPDPQPAGTGAPAVADIEPVGEVSRASAVGGATGPSAERAANLAEVARLGAEYLALDHGGTTAGFLAWLASTVRADEPAGDGDAVDLVTFHGAKGLEWPVVHLAGLERGLVPIHHATTTAAQDEERRLLYVALTRARDQLHCTWARYRTYGTRTSRREPSVWLADLERAQGLLAGYASPAPPPDPVRRGRAQSRTAPRLPAGLTRGDQDLFDALSTWRAGQAKLTDVPPFVILTDDALVGIATNRPRDSHSLLDLAGLGPVKSQRFGPDLLRLVAAHPPKDR